MTAAEPTVTDLAALPTVHRAESAAKRRQRYSAGVLIILAGALLLFFLFSTQGLARFALSNAFDAVQLPTLEVPGFATVAVCGVLCVFAGVGYLIKLPGRLPAVAGAVGGLTFVIGFLAWAAAGRDLPFPVSNQFAGTLTVATPLIFGALCGVLCERAGVVNVSIEGQFLVAAFAAAVVGSVTGSVPAALFAAILAGMAMAALLALFAIKYLVNQVVLGVVLNLLAIGITGFLFDQLVEPASAEFNSAPVLEKIAIPGLSSIPFFGPVLFEQTILAYLAGLSVLLVWFVLFKTVLMWSTPLGGGGGGRGGGQGGGAGRGGGQGQGQGAPAAGGGRAGGATPTPSGPFPVDPAQGVKVAPPAVPPGEGAPAPTTKGFIAFEPMVAITNALNLAHKGVYKDLQSIPPGGSWEESFWLTTKGY